MAVQEDFEPAESPLADRGGEAARVRLRVVAWVVAVMVFLGAVIAFLLAQVPGAPPRTQVVDGTRMDFDTVPPEPTAGPTTLRVAIHDLEGRPRRGARVWFSVGMDAMPSMGGAKDLQARETEPGVYAAAFSFPMAGIWGVRVRAEVPGEAPQERHFVLAAR